METSLIRNLLSKYSLNKLATITGFSIALLRDLRAGKIPDHITNHNGAYIAAKSILEKQIIASVKNHKIKLKEVT